jgi:hypothetical protein
MRRLEQRVDYGNGLVEEWEPVPLETEHWPDLWGMTAVEVSTFVRKWNRDAKARGDRTRIRSVEVEED